MITYTEKEFKSILNIRKIIDHWFWDKYGINPYNGCQFGCIYCDSRSFKYHLPDDFENNIIIKKDIGIMLDKRLTNARLLLPDVVGMGGTTDSYQPAENKYKNTRKCLEVLNKHNYPVHIITKSNIVLNDLDLLDNIGKNTWCSISLTITTLNEELSKFLEKHAINPQARLNTIKSIKKKSNNIQTGVLLMPVIPYLTDSITDIEQIIKQAKEANADYVIFGGGMTMRDIQALWFLKHLKEKYPKLIKKYEELYNFKYNADLYSGNYNGSNDYYINLNNIFIELCIKHQMPYRIKRFIPNDYRKINYIISEKLLNKSYVQQINDKSWTTFFWAGQNIQNLKEPIIDIIKRNQLTSIRGIGEKLANYIKEEVEQIKLKS